MLCLVGTNLALALQTPSFFALFAESVEPTERGNVFSLYQFYLGLSMAIGPLAGAVLIKFLSIRSQIIITGIASIIAAIYRIFTITESKTPDHHQAEALDTPSSKDNILLTLIIVGSAFSVIAPLTVTGPFMPLYADRKLGFSETQINLMFAAGSFAATFASLLGGKITNKLGSWDVVKISVILHAGLTLIWASTGLFWLNVLGFSLAYSFIQFATISYDTLRIEISWARSRGKTLGTLGTITGIAAALAAPFAGAIQPAMGQATPFVLALIFGLITLYFVNRLAHLQGVKNDLRKNLEDIYQTSVKKTCVMFLQRLKYYYYTRKYYVKKYIYEKKTRNSK